MNFNNSDAPANVSHFQLSFGLAFVASLALLLGVVASYATSWPQRDAFIFFDWLLQVRSGDLSLVSLVFARNNEHLVGVQYLVSLGVLWLFDGNFKSLIYMNAALLLSVIALCGSFAAKEEGVARWSWVAALLVCVPFINPVQASYLLWEFQLWWYIVLFCAVIACWSLEASRPWSLPVAVLACATATLSGTQGSFVWLVAAAYLMLLDYRDRFAFGATTGRRFFLALGAVVIFALVAATVLFGRSAATGQAAGFQALGLPAYFVQLIGGVFGVRRPSVAFTLGTALVVAWVLIVVVSLRFGSARRPLFRLGFGLSLLGLLSTLAFAFGRQRYGIEWALWNFHASPPVISFVAGTALAALGLLSLDRQALPRLLVLSAAFCGWFTLVPSVTAIPAGHQRAAELLRVTSLAHIATCQVNDFPRYVQLRLNGLEEHADLFDRVKTLVMEACGRPVNVLAAGDLLSQPKKFHDLAAAEPRLSDALSALWWVYVTRLDLQRAYPPTAPNTPEKLLQFAYFNARGGSGYESELLPGFANEFLAIGLER